MEMPEASPASTTETMAVSLALIPTLAMATSPNCPTISWSVMASSDMMTLCRVMGRAIRPMSDMNALSLNMMFPQVMLNDLLVSKMAPFYSHVSPSPRICCMPHVASLLNQPRKVASRITPGRTHR